MDTHPTTFRLPRIIPVSLCAALCVTIAPAKVVRTSKAAGYQEAVNSCVAGDVLIVDSDGGSNNKIKDPPSDLQIIGGSADWELTKDVSDIVLVNHTPRITQTGGKLRRVVSNTSLGRGSRLTHVDSCFFHMGNMGRDGINYEIDGFLRHSTFGFNGSFMGASTINFMSPKSIYGETWTKHASSFVVNATDPVGDGSGTLICNIVSHGQIDWTPVHVINGRGIMVAHVNSEYCEWADPFVAIENGVECASIHHNPGGHQGALEWDKYLDLNDGTRGYPWMGNRWGTWRIGGMNNTAIGGTNYVAIRTGLTGSAWSAMVSRDPYLTKWNAVHGGGINFALPLSCMSFGGTDQSMMKQADHPNGGKAYVISGMAACTTKFIDAAGLPQTGSLKSRALRPGPSLYRPYVPPMPDLKLDTEGPGIDASTRTPEQIAGMVNAGQTVYLGPGTYTMPGALTSGTVWGAGKDKTILKFPAGQICTRDKIGMYNLTVEGGTIGYKQDNPSCHSFRGAGMRFRGQSEVGVEISCVQNCAGFVFIDFEGCTRGMRSVGNCQTLGMNDAKAIDKMNIYGCTFRNLESGLSLSGGTDGFFSLIGCRFENITGTGASLNSKGNYVAGCEFINCAERAINARYVSTIHNCAIIGASTSKGITGAFSEIISCSISGCGTAIEVGGSDVVISDVEADGSITRNATTWIGRSKAGNVANVDGAYFGDTDLSAWVDNTAIQIDQTPPTEPTGLQVSASGGHNVLTWNRSSDPESGIMQYIVERDGQEIGRTNYNYSANYHVVDLDGMWGAEGWPGAGVYKHPAPVYVDSNSTAPAASYKAVALNHAQIRSDNTMAALQLWTHTIYPYRLTGSDGAKHIRLSDSVYVTPGKLTLSAASGGKGFAAVRYRPVSGSGIVRGVHALVVGTREPQRQRGAAEAGWRRELSRELTVYTLSGARVATVRLGDASTLTAASTEAGVRALNLAKGIYVLRRAGQPLRTVDLR